METSTTWKNLTTALIKVQKELKPAKKETENPFFKSKYADLGSVVESCRESLLKNGFAVSQVFGFENGVNFLRTILLHESGEWLKSDYPLTPTKSDPQAFGSAGTYARRYSLAAIVGVVTEDDDANSATHTNQETQKEKTETKTTTKTLSGDLISDAQGKRLFAMWKTAGKTQEEVLNHLKTTYGISNTRNITKDIYEDVCEWVQQPVEAEVGF